MFNPKIRAVGGQDAFVRVDGVAAAANGQIDETLVLHQGAEDGAEELGMGVPLDAKTGLGLVFLVHHSPFDGDVSVQSRFEVSLFTCVFRFGRKC